MFNALALMLMPEMTESGLDAGGWLGMSAAAFITALLAFLPLLPQIRQWLARWLPINPDSLVHMTALVFAIYQIGLSLGQMALLGNLKVLANSEELLTIWDVVLSGIPLVLFALAGVGLLIRRRGPGTWQRLGLRRPTWKQLLAAVGIAVLLLGFDFLVSWVWQGLDPAGYDMLEKVNENLFGGLATVGGAIALGLSAGISEELLFRGAVQPRLGLLLTTVLFTIGHLQYGLTLATLQVFVIGLVFGLMRKRTGSVIVCMVSHATYNMVGTLLGMI
ncbi:MAG: CPBP family intramembrane metalloprotease, partial [Anaerolineae bacterium]|nr:CPBP family intramembrane metalloprotease [Anaerolineae bacterium]